MSKKRVARKDERAAQLEHLYAADTAARDDGTYPDVPELAEPFPLLNAMLTVTEVAGKARKPATVTIWCEPDGVKAVFSDRHRKRKLWAQAPSIGGLWGELEAALQSRSPDWRSDQGTKWKGRS